MSEGMEYIVSPGDNWNVKIISSENLIWLIDCIQMVSILLHYLFFHYFHVYFRDPRISVYDCDENAVRFYHFLMKNWLEMFCTPRNIWSLSFLLIFSDLMKSVVHDSKFILEGREQFFAFLVRSRFVCLHCHKYKVVCFGFFVGSKKLKGFG